MIFHFVLGTSHKRRAQSAGLTRTSREKWISAVKKGQTSKSQCTCKQDLKLCV